MGKLQETDIPIIVSLLKEGERFGEIAEALEVSCPTLRKFMLENDLYKHSTNENSLKISRSQSKYNDSNTLKAMIEDVMDHQNDLYQEDVEFLEDLLKKGTSIGNIARMYHRSRGTVREYLKTIGLYQKYCSDNKFENSSRKKQFDKMKKVEEEVKKEIKINAVVSRPKYAKSASTESQVQNTVKEETSVKEPLLDNKDTNNLENSVEEVTNNTSLDFSNSDYIVNDVVLNYINKNMKKISMEARLDDLSNTLMDRIISNFSEEELKDVEIKTEIKRTLVKLVEELL